MIAFSFFVPSIEGSSSNLQNKDWSEKEENGGGRRWILVVGRPRMAKNKRFDCFMFLERSKESGAHWVPTSLWFECLAKNHVGPTTIKAYP